MPVEIPDGVLQEAAALYGLALSDLRLLGGTDGAAYEFARDGRSYVLKVAPLPADQPDQLVATREKLDFVSYLGERGVSLSRPVESTRGSLVESVEGESSLYAVSAAGKAQGQHAVQQGVRLMGPALYREWGRVLGQMHRLTLEYRGGEHIIHWRDEYEFMVAICADDAEVVERWRRLGDHLATLPTDDGYGLVHNDVHQYNFLVSGPADAPRLTLFDFDVCAHHWFVAEIGLAVFHTLWEGPSGRMRDRSAFAREFLGHLLGGYREERDLSPFWLGEIAHFVEYRRLLLYSVFRKDWGERGNDWQKRQVAAWRAGIVGDLPVVDLGPDLLSSG